MHAKNFNQQGGQFDYWTRKAARTCLPSIQQAMEAKMTKKMNKRRWKCSRRTTPMEATRKQGRQDHDARRTHGSTSLTGSIIFAPFFVHAPPSIFYVFFWFVKELSVIERTFSSQSLPPVRS
jgi:hypothetical protein